MMAKVRQKKRSKLTLWLSNIQIYIEEKKINSQYMDVNDVKNH